MRLTSKISAIALVGGSLWLAAISSSYGQANDACAGAIALTAGVPVTASTAAATSTGDPVPNCTDVGTPVKGIWYTFTPASSGLVTVTTCSSAFDTVLAAFTGTCGSLTNIACDDDSDTCGVSSTQSSIQFNGTAGTTYRFLAGGYAGASGSLTIVANVGAFGTANLAPYQPAGWSGKIVVSKNPGTSTDDTPLLPSDSLYVDWAVLNSGSTATPGAFLVSLYIDGVLDNIWTSGGSLPASTYVFIQDYAIGTLPAGTHTLRIVADASYVVAESSEADNEFTKTISVGGSSNNRPVANPQSVSVLKNTPAAITLTATDADNNPLTYSVVASPSNGLLSGSPPNVVYSPNNNYVGPDTFTFKANDGLTDSVPALVSITVGNSAGLIIVPVWDSTITSDPNASTIMNTISNAITAYELKFSDNVTVQITFRKVSTGLGMSSTFISTMAYSSFYNALVADSKTTNDTTALAHVTGGGSNPVNGGANITATLPNLRALGFNANPGGGQSDSTISLNISQMNLDRGTINPAKYDLMAVASHEMDEVLGTISGVGGANIFPADLYRYTGASARTWTTAGDDAYFSINAANNLARYNQDAGGDYGDWWSIGAHTAQVQDAFGTPGATPNLGVELTVLDVVGWDLVTTVAAGAPAFQTVRRTNNTVYLTWSSVASRSYQVQYRTNVASGTWNNLGGPIVASGATTSTTDTVLTDKQRFYRVALLPAIGLAPPDHRPDVVMSEPTLRTTYLLPQRAQPAEEAPSSRAGLKPGRALPVARQAEAGGQ